jgi:hypothetical protein
MPLNQNTIMISQRYNSREDITRIFFIFKNIVIFMFGRELDTEENKKINK